MTIATVTPNPALDVTYVVDALEAGAENRVGEVLTRPGGKGINTANVLRHLGVDVLVLAMVGGVGGDELRDRLAADGMRHSLAPIAGGTRRTVAVLDRSTASTTLFNEPGPTISASEWTGFLDTVARAAIDMRVVTMSGSLPRGLSVDAYAELVTAARSMPGRDRAVVVDTSGPPLLAACSAEPDLVKPNLVELAAVLPSIADPLDRAHELLRRGARGVVVSAGSDGLRLLTPRMTVTGRLRQALSGNATGAGDAVVAALAEVLAACDDTRSLLADPLGAAELVRRAVAVSAAAVLAPVAGEVNAKDVSMLMNEVEVTDG